MEEDEELENVDLEVINIGNILNNRNQISPKLIEFKDMQNELYHQKNKEKKEFLLKKNAKINIDKICNNNSFVLIIYFLHTLISLGTFYLYYIYINLLSKMLFCF